MVSKRKREEIDNIIREAKKNRIMKLKVAVDENELDYVRRIIIDSRITKKEIDESSIIEEIITKGPECMKIIEYLVEQGANINLPNPNHRNVTPINNVAASLHLGENHKNMLEKLINLGADINIPDQNLNTPLLNCIIYTRSEDSIEFLIEQGAILSAKNDEGLTALHYASMYDLPRIVSKILQLDFDHSKAKDNFGLTPMVYAIEADCEKVVKEILMLSESKIDLIIKNNDKGITALELALEKENQKRNPRMVKMILYNNL